MDDVVIDSSVAVKWYVLEQNSTESRRLFGEYRNGKLTLLAPDLIYAEFGNIMWKKQAFQNFDPLDAANIVDEFQKGVTLTLTSTKELLDEAYSLAVAKKRSVYDMLYLALSLRVGCKFVTADEKLVNAVGPAFPNVVWLANWP